LFLVILGFEMNINDLRAKDMEGLKTELKELLRAQFSLRMQLSTQQTNKTHEIRRVRRDIARVRTVMQQANSKVGN
jgi:large subunit ribosomal protein L29